MISPHDFIDSCREADAEIRDAVGPMIGTEFGSEILGMGADNTPTERMDRVAESIVIDRFAGIKACRTIVSEEAGCVGIGGDAGCIYLDPIDGSTNAGRGIPFYALSAALADDAGLAAGYVANLAANEVFTAVRGEGAYLNGRRIRTSDRRMFSDAVLSVYASPHDIASLVEQGIISRRYRRFGAAALELCYVACGRLEGFLDLRGILRITDVAAGCLILREAGGLVTLPDGGDFVADTDITRGFRLLGANMPIHAEISGAMKKP